MNEKKAIILLSGGLDSTTVLAIAKSKKFKIYTMSFDYGQRHRSELMQAKKIAEQYQSAEHKIFTIDLATFGGSALTDKSIKVPENSAAGIPITYVPARNTVFLSLALAWAEVVNVFDIFIGVNAVDYSGYPDCRPEYIAAFEKMANLATKSTDEGGVVKIHTPLIDFSKAQILEAGMLLGVDYSQTVSCYQADEKARACGKCDSCRLRKQGFADANLADVTVYQP